MILHEVSLLPGLSFRAEVESAVFTAKIPRSVATRRAADPLGQMRSTAPPRGQHAAHVAPSVAP
jgi:hypothetical protein